MLDEKFLLDAKSGSGLAIEVLDEKSGATS
jgi:hypothetical protein